MRCWRHLEPAIYLFKDFHPFTDENRANLAVIQRLKDVAYNLRDTYQTIVIVAQCCGWRRSWQDVRWLTCVSRNGGLQSSLDRIIDDVKISQISVSILMRKDGNVCLHAARRPHIEEARERLRQERWF